MSVPALLGSAAELWRVMPPHNAQRLHPYEASRRWSRVHAPSAYERTAVKGAV